MGLCVTFVSGPRASGKSTIISAMVDELWKAKPHYLRLVRTGSDKPRPKSAGKSLPDCGVSTARWLDYDDDHVIELLTEALTIIHKKDRYGSVVIEADAEPSLRHAYPYDHRVFVMPVPGSIGTVFREASRAAEELQRVLDDTVAFASEIFGLFEQSGSEDAEPHEARPDLTDTQMRGFLYSPLGDELATRIQLKQAFHGLVESDVIIVNQGVGTPGSETEECLRRIERLLARIRGVSERRGELFLCPLRDRKDAGCRKLLKALRPMCQGGR